MGEATGFLQWARETPTRRPVPVRLTDWREVYEPFPAERDGLSEDDTLALVMEGAK